MGQRTASQLPSGLQPDGNDRVYPQWDVLCDLEQKARAQAEERRAKVQQQRDELEQLRQELRELESGTWVGALRSVARMGGRALLRGGSSK